MPNNHWTKSGRREIVIRLSWPGFIVNIHLIQSPFPGAIMNTRSIAPCGLNCELCSGFQREKDRCVGCLRAGGKPSYCTSCKVKLCPEKKGKATTLCSKCQKYPCKRIKDLNKRYSNKYGESNIDNLSMIQEIGLSSFIEFEKDKWKCRQCGTYLCVHKGTCPACGAINPFYPFENHERTRT